MSFHSGVKYCAINILVCELLFWVKINVYIAELSGSDGVISGK